MQSPECRHRNAWGADLETDADDRIELPRRQNRHDARGQLDVHELSRGTPLAYDAPNTLTVKWVPGIMNNSVLPDMGRMTAPL